MMNTEELKAKRKVINDNYRKANREKINAYAKERYHTNEEVREARKEAFRRYYNKNKDNPEFKKKRKQNKKKYSSTIKENREAKREENRIALYNRIEKYIPYFINELGFLLIKNTDLQKIFKNDQKSITFCINRYRQKNGFNYDPYYYRYRPYRKKQS